MACLLSVLLVGEALWSDVEGDPVLLTAAGLLTGLSLTWRRARPLLAIAASCAGIIALVTIAREGPQEPQTPLLVLLVAAYSAGAHAPRRTALAGLALVIAAILTNEAGDVIVLGPLSAGAWATGRLWRARENDARRLSELAEALERARVEEGRVAIAEERARIARELHDVVGHAMTRVVVSAGAERMHLDPGQERTWDVLRDIESTGREALAELRRLLGVLRRDGDAPALAPQPGLAALGGLVARVRATGLNVELRVEGPAVDVGPGLDISAYRIVQEGLTNVLKHAAARHAWVRVRFAQDALTLEVADDGRGPNGAAGGHGLAGLRERAALFGGELHAGARTGGGFELTAHIPLEGR